MVPVRVLSLFGLPVKTELFVPSAEALSSFSVLPNGREFFHTSRSTEVMKWLKVRVRDRVRAGARECIACLFFFISLQNVVNILSSFVHVV